MLDFEDISVSIYPCLVSVSIYSCLLVNLGNVFAPLSTAVSAETWREKINSERNKASFKWADDIILEYFMFGIFCLGGDDHVKKRTKPWGQLQNENVLAPSQGSLESNK